MNNQDLEFIAISKQSGEKYGYPECCISEFCKATPSKLQSGQGINRHEAELRYKAGCINGQFSGFIPCIKHAKEIIDKKITLESLINRQTRSVPMPFPYDWSLK